MSVIPCEKNALLTRKINEFAETLKTEAHTLGNHGMSEQDFYNSGLFRGAIERLRGQIVASMGEKRDFVKRLLNYMQDNQFIQEWESSGSENRHDYSVKLRSGKIAVIELKGCLDGNNTNIYERPPHAQEFIIWSVCTNSGADPRKNAWSGIHTRLSADIISRGTRVDGLVIWDMACGTVGRPCPKLTAYPGRVATVGQFTLPPPCIYMFPATVPHARNNPSPVAQPINNVEIMSALQSCFKGRDDEVNYVDFEVSYRGQDTVRTTRIRRNNQIVKQSEPTAIRRT
jgi:hypothetical protein